MESKSNTEEKVFSVPKVPIAVSKLQTKQVVDRCLDYVEPQWSSKPPEDEKYYLEVIKNGTQMENIELANKNFYIFGRHETCDFIMEHPSLSRFHLILQYSNGQVDTSYSKGFYLYDLNSTHGTILNKKQIESKTYVRLVDGCVIKIGGSTRLYIYHAPETVSSNDDDLKINLTHEQMRKIKEKYDRISNKIKINRGMNEAEQVDKNAESDEGGVDWGMSDLDNGEEEKLSADALHLIENQSYNDKDESFYSSDPRKALKIFFDREGEELYYEFEELGYGSFSCRIRLPIDNNLGEPMYAESKGSAKKKEIQAQCALEACRLLDAHGILRESKEQMRRKRKEKNWENADYYDSDEDIYLDRTGEIEKKRQKRMKQLKASENATNFNDKGKVHTFDSLKDDYLKLVEEQIDIMKKLDKCKNIEKAVESDDLDAYIQSLKQGDSMDHFTRTKLKRRLTDLNQEVTKCEKLISIAKTSNFDMNKWKSDLRLEMEKNHEQKANFITKKIDQIKPLESLKEVEKQVLDEARVIEAQFHEEKQIVKTATKRTEHNQKKSEIESNDDYTDFSKFKEYSTWLPPENQSGDGRTKLNEKFGY